MTVSVHLSTATKEAIVSASVNNSKFLFMLVKNSLNSSMIGGICTVVVSTISLNN